jgi:signal transduction histidine kinase
MRKFNTPYIADWFAISLRWLALMGIVVSMGLGLSLTVQLFWPLALLIVWNLGLTVLAGLNIRISYHRFISFGIDLLLTGIFFWMQGRSNGIVWWAGILPIITGAVYFDFWGALAAAIIFSALLYILVPVAGGIAFQSSLFSHLLTGFTLALVLLFGFLGRQLASCLRSVRNTALDAEQKIQHIESERLRAIYELTSTLSTTLSYKRVLDSALDIAYSALNPESEDHFDERLVGAVLLFKGSELQIGSARRFTNADMRTTFQGAEGILKKVFDEGDPVIFKDIGYDPELGRVIALRNCTSAFCFPLRSGFNIYGVLLFAHPEPNYFTPDRCDLLEIIGRQSVGAIQNARLYQDLTEEKERMIEVHEEARKKLARDLHDGPTQSVAAMAMRVNIVRRIMKKDVKTAGDELAKIEELAHRTTKEIRHMLFTLRPLILESQGLGAALTAMADKMKETYGQVVVIEVDDNIAGQMEIGKQGVAFYIAEEAVNNARKHANASTIWVRFRAVEPNLVLLEITDNGIGFDVKAVTESYENRSSSSLGMVNLRERTELINGLLHIDSAPGKGTRIMAYIPLTEEAADRLHHSRN